MPLFLLKYWPQIALIIGILGTAGYLYFKGVQDTREKIEKQAVKEYVNTRKKIDETPTPSDADAAREWLLNRQR